MPAASAPWLSACPRCGRSVPAEPSPLATFFLCRGCGVEWVEDLALDFRTD